MHGKHVPSHAINRYRPWVYSIFTEPKLQSVHVFSFVSRLRGSTEACERGSASSVIVHDFLPVVPQGAYICLNRVPLRFMFGRRRRRRTHIGNFRDVGENGCLTFGLHVRMRYSHHTPTRGHWPPDIHRRWCPGTNHCPIYGRIQVQGSTHLESRHQTINAEAEVYTFTLKCDAAQEIHCRDGQ